MISQRTLEREVATWQRRLGLDAWRVFLHPSPVETLSATEWARLDPSRESMTAALYVATKREDAEVLESIRHEMLHLACVDLDFVVNLVREELQPAAWNLLKDCWEDAHERLVIRLERMCDGEKVLSYRP